MTSLSPRNACPTVGRPMATGDGLLARLPPVGPLAVGALIAIAQAAERFGNGLVEITARGSIQVRGLSAGTASSFTAAMAEAGIADASPAILAPPLAGLDPTEVVDVQPLVRAVREALAAGQIRHRLAPKTSVVIDGGGSLHLDAIDADLRLVATDAASFHLALGGSAATAQPVGSVTPDRAADAVLAVLALLADAGPAARGRDLDALAIAAAVGATPERLATRPSAEPVGIHRLADGACAVGVGLPFGQIEAATLAVLVRDAEACGAVAFAPAPGRTLLAVGLSREDAAPFRQRAGQPGFIARAGDPRRAISACAGAPACAAGLMPGRAIAAGIAAAAAPILDGSVTLHISGCAKGCAHPRAATLAFTGGENGAGLVIAGRAGDDAVATVAPGDMPAAVTRLAAAVDGARRAGETSAGAIARLGAQRLASILRREPADA